MVPEVAGSIPVVHPENRAVLRFYRRCRWVLTGRKESCLQGVDPLSGSVILEASQQTADVMRRVLRFARKEFPFAEAGVVNTPPEPQAD